MTSKEEDLKYILGNMGIEILESIEKGASNIETIKLFSGIPVSCIRGRIPVLLELNLIGQNTKGYFITRKGTNFRKILEKNKI